MASAYGAGAGAEMLQQILRQKFAEAIQQQHVAQEQQRIQQEGERLKMAAADRQAAMQDLAQSRAIQNAGRVANALRIGQVVAPETVGALKAGNLGDLVQHEQADLPSTALSGIAQAGAAAPTLRGVKMATAGRPERDTFTGTSEQLAGEQQRQDRLAQLASAAEDRKVAREAAAHSPAYREWQDAIANGFKGSFTDYQNEDANRKERAAGGGQGARPYYTYQPTYDAAGRPTGAIRFDARGGPPTVVDISAMTGGSQIKPPPGTTGQQAIGNEVSSVQLGRLKDMYDKGASKLIGPAEGRARSVGQNLPLVPVNKKFSDFKAATDAFKNSVIKAITGAQLSEPEAKRIIGQIPTENDKPEVWQSKYEQTQKNLGDLENVLSKKSGGTQAPGPKPPANETPDQRLKRLLGGG